MVSVSTQAQIAINSLSSEDRRNVERHIRMLNDSSQKGIANRGVKKLDVPGEVYIMRVSAKLRLIFRYVNGVVEVLDIVTQERLERMFRYAQGVG